MNINFYINEGWHVLKRDLSKKEYKQHKGGGEQVCKQVVKDRWNGTFFEAGETIYNNQFWIRDFSLCLDGLINLGYKKQAKETLEWAIKNFAREDKIATTVTAEGEVVDLFHFSADSLPFLLSDLLKTKQRYLVEKHKKFINSQIEIYYKKVLDHQTNLIKNEPFSTPKDVVMRTKTCVANSFMVFLSELLKNDFPELNNPFKNIDLVTPFINSFWNKEKKYFKNDLMDNEGDVVSADANIIPYYLGIVKNKTMAKASIDAIKKEKLDKPFPLKYHSFSKPKWMKTQIGARIFSPNYQGDSIWTMMGPIYIDLESKFYTKDAGIHIAQYLNWIEKHQTYIELFEADGHLPLEGRFGHSAETGMLWASMIPPLAKKLGFVQSDA
ncbi:MAG: hypothetical protein HYV90_00640 [Candidatus Woesebacteria bacterium]|nr:MAG: hypothetical protein HYV90_00640 [Candidatus Woesebacteria bacterium]